MYYATLKKRKTKVLKVKKKVFNRFITLIAISFFWLDASMGAQDSLDKDIMEDLDKDLVDLPQLSPPLRKKSSIKKTRLEASKSYTLYQELRFSSMEGKKILTLKEYSYKLPILLIFWGSFCGPCLREFPSLERLASLMPNLKIVCVAIDGPNDITSTLPLFYINQGKNNQDFLAKYRVQSIPAFFLFDAAGKLLWNGVGAKEWDSVPVINTLKTFIHPSTKERNFKQKRLKKICIEIKIFGSSQKK